MMMYLNMNLVQTLLIAVVPYLGFDAAKIVICTIVIKLLPDKIKGKTPVNSEEKEKLED